MKRLRQVAESSQKEAVGTWKSWRLAWISLGRGSISSGGSSVMTFWEKKEERCKILWGLRSSS